MTRSDACQIARRRVAFRTAARTFEITLPCYRVSGLKIFYRHAATAAGMRYRLCLALANEGDNAACFLIREVEGRHFVIRAPLVNDLGDFFSGAVFADEFRLRQVGTCLASH